MKLRSDSSSNISINSLLVNDIKITDKKEMANKDLAVEKIYQKKSQLEHILLRPDTYIGSVELLQQEMWIWDFEGEKMIKKEISFVPGLYKIFDEILGNFKSFML